MKNRNKAIYAAVLLAAAVTFGACSNGNTSEQETSLATVQETEPEEEELPVVDITLEATEEVSVDEASVNEDTDETVTEEVPWEERYEDILEVGVPVEEFLASDLEGVELYRDYIGSEDYYKGFAEDYLDASARCMLIYLDDDDIPELAVIDGNYHVAPIKIVSIDDSGNYYCEIMCFGEFGAIKYAERKGIIRLVYGNQGYFVSYYIHVAGGEREFLGCALSNGSGHPYDEDGNPAPMRYTIEIPMTDEKCRKIAEDPYYFADGSKDYTEEDYTNVDVEAGKDVDEEAYMAYEKSFIGDGSTAIRYGR